MSTQNQNQIVRVLVGDRSTNRKLKRKRKRRGKKQIISSTPNRILQPVNRVGPLAVGPGGGSGTFSFGGGAQQRIQRQPDPRLDTLIDSVNRLNRLGKYAESQFERPFPAPPAPAPPAAPAAAATAPLVTQPTPNINVNVSNTGPDRPSTANPFDVPSSTPMQASEPARGKSGVRVSRKKSKPPKSDVSSKMDIDTPPQMSQTTASTSMDIEPRRDVPPSIVPPVLKQQTKIEGLKPQPVFPNPAPVSNPIIPQQGAAAADDGGDSMEVSTFSVQDQIDKRQKDAERMGQVVDVSQDDDSKQAEQAEMEVEVAGVQPGSGPSLQQIQNQQRTAAEIMRSNPGDVTLKKEIVAALQNQQNVPQTVRQQQQEAASELAHREIDALDMIDVLGHDAGAGGGPGYSLAQVAQNRQAIAQIGSSAPESREIKEELIRNVSSPVTNVYEPPTIAQSASQLAAVKREEAFARDRVERAEEPSGLMEGRIQYTKEGGGYEGNWRSEQGPDSDLDSD